MITLDRAPANECREKALPILEKGYNSRGSLRSESENSSRAEIKRSRDEQHRSRPHFCSI